MNKPLVSILMTVYNREDYLNEAINSVINSTYTNWELIIVDDLSTDKSVEIAMGYVAKDSRIKLFINETNLGDYNNRNRAASYSSGKYIKYLDADDYIYPNGLEIMVSTMESNPSASIGFCTIPPEKDQPFPITLSPKDTFQRHYLDKQSIFYKSPLSAIIKRKSFEEIGGFSGKRFLGDFELWIKMCLKYNIVLMQQGLIWYRVHEQQESSNNRSNPLIPFKYMILELDILRNKNIPLSDIKLNGLLKATLKRISRYILKSLMVNKFNITFELKKLSKLNWFQIFKYSI